MPQYRTFESGKEFIRRNLTEDKWFLQIETFDPHEPYFTQQHYKSLYPHDYHGRHFDWPPYMPVTESEEEVEHVRYEDVYKRQILQSPNRLSSQSICKKSDPSIFPGFWLPAPQPRRCPALRTISQPLFGLSAGGGPEPGGADLRCLRRGWGGNPSSEDGYEAYL